MNFGRPSSIEWVPVLQRSPDSDPVHLAMRGAARVSSLNETQLRGNTMKDRLDEVLGSAVERGDVPGVVAVAFDREGMTYEGGFGERVLGSDVVMTPDTVGAIFSMTKAVTGAAAMLEVERGNLSLDAPAGEVCPELGAVQVLEGFADDGTPSLRPPATPVTLRHLLTHTSGFVYEIWNPEYAAYLEATGTPSVLSLEKASLRGPIMFDPGTRWEYGIGIDWAGQMVEAVSGGSLGQYFSENLFEPMGMSDTGFAPTESMLGRMAGAHARMPDGTLAPIDLATPENPEFEMGGGGLLGTMADYARFCRMVLNGGELDGTRVMSQETVDAMCANAMGPLRVAPLISGMPAFSNDAELFAGEEKSWGLTFQIHEEPGHTGRPAGTLSWAGLANSYFWIDRTTGIGGAYLTQILPFADTGSLQTYYNFESGVYDSAA